MPPEPPAAAAKMKGREPLLLVVASLWLLLAAAIVASQLLIPHRIVISWATETEFETAGFNIYRSDAPDGEFTLINDRLIASAADPAGGASYTYEDRGLAPGRAYYYRLEDVEYDNSRRQHEVLSRTVPYVEGWAVALAAASALTGGALLAAHIRRPKA